MTCCSSIALATTCPSSSRVCGHAAGCLSKRNLIQSLPEFAETSIERHECLRTRPHRAQSDVRLGIRSAELAKLTDRKISSAHNRQGCSVIPSAPLEEGRVPRPASMY